MTIQVQQLSKSINAKPVLADINFTFAPGEIIGLVGRNGVGKTSLMRTMVDQYHPDGGAVLIDGADAASVPEKRAAIFYLDNDAIFFKHWRMTQIAAMFTPAYPDFDAAAFYALLARFELANPRYATLSKGYQALVRVALAIASQAPYVLFDEPFDGLDVIVRRQIVDLVIDMVADGTRGVLIASHDLAELDGLADRVLMLKDSRLIQDIRLEDLRQRAVKRQLVFAAHRLPAVVHEHGRILAVQGRVATVLFTDYNPAVAAALEAANPVLNEALPLRLEDLFVSELKEVHHG